MQRRIENANVRLESIAREVAKSIEESRKPFIDIKLGVRSNLFFCSKLAGGNIRTAEGGRLKVAHDKLLVVTNCFIAQKMLLFVIQIVLISRPSNSTLFSK